jgi:APA family basic amino acid/polyamine antiporter
MSVLLGPVGRVVISAGIACSTFGFLNLVILVTPRVFQAMAADGLFFERFARLHPRFRTPVPAIVFMGVWSAVLVYSGQYGALLDYATFGDWIFFGLTAATLLVFRRRDGVQGIAFRVPGFPVAVWLFVAAAGYVVVGSVLSNPVNALRGTGLLALGVPVYLYWRSVAARR